MAALVTRRAQLLELRVAEAQRADTCADLDLRKLFTPWLVPIALTKTDPGALRGSDPVGGKRQRSFSFPRRESFRGVQAANGQW
jgi:hypothetical protein